jgi:hypothetical protein
MISKKKKSNYMHLKIHFMSINEEYSNKLTTLMSDRLSRFSGQIRQIEVQIWDEEKGLNDKHCTLEARLQGKQPVTVSDYAATHDHAIEGAIEKLKFALDRIVGRNEELRGFA